jgi:hypothetical protein
MSKINNIGSDGLCKCLDSDLVDGISDKIENLMIRE